MLKFKGGRVLLNNKTEWELVNISSIFAVVMALKAAEAPDCDVARVELTDNVHWRKMRVPNRTLYSRIPATEKYRWTSTTHARN